MGGLLSFSLGGRRLRRWFEVCKSVFLVGESGLLVVIGSHSGIGV